MLAYPLPANMPDLLWPGWHWERHENNRGIVWFMMAKDAETEREDES